MKKHKGTVLDSINGFDVIECTSCGFKHIMPLITPEELTRFYEKNFYTKERPNYFKDMKADYEWWMETYKNWFALFAKHTKGRRLLDIGSGPGYFLKCGKDLGWDVLGIEPSQHACDYAKTLGVKTIQGFFSKEALKDEKKFDVITLNLVLEHIPNPHELLTDAKSLLKKGGLILVMSPNDYSPFQHALRTQKKFKPWWVVPEHHINYFNFRSMEQLMKKTGLNVVESLATFPIDMFLLFGDNYIGNRTVGRKMHAKRKQFEQTLYADNPQILNELYRSLAQSNIGREFVVIGKLT